MSGQRNVITLSESSGHALALCVCACVRVVRVQGLVDKERDRQSGVEVQDCYSVPQIQGKSKFTAAGAKGKKVLGYSLIIRSNKFKDN